MIARLLAAVLLIAPAHAQPAAEAPAFSAPAARFAAAIEEADADMAALREAQGLPALQVAVLVEGEVVFSKAYGFSDLDSREPATTETRFRIASISKAITGAALARLAARGEIDLDLPLGEYVPDLPEHWHAITARQLASHTSGIRHYRGMEIWNVTHYPTLRESLVIFDDDELLFEPGAKREYSTYGFTLLGVAMEFMTDKSFMELVEAELLDPLGMADTLEDRSDTDGVATAYLLDNEQSAHVSPPTDNSYKVPGGGIVSTAEDLVRLAWAVIEADPLEAEALPMLRERAKTADGKAHSYSLGWNVSGEEGNLRLSHGGSQPGSRTFLLADVDGRIAVAMLCNARGAKFGFADVERVAGYFKN